MIALTKMRPRSRRVRDWALFARRCHWTEFARRGCARSAGVVGPMAV